MMTVRVECLGCGAFRLAGADPHGRVAGGECPACGYVGWAPSNALTESVRHTLWEQPAERRLPLRAA